MQPDLPHGALREHLDRLRRAAGVGDVHGEIRKRVVRLLGVDRGQVEVEGLGVEPHMRDGVVRIARRAGDVDGEIEVPLELLLDQRLVVGEDEAAALAALLELGRPAERVPTRVGPVGELAVRV